MQQMLYMQVKDENMRGSWKYNDEYLDAQNHIERKVFQN
jgi:hypothetical protein